MAGYASLDEVRMDKPEHEKALECFIHELIPGLQPTPLLSQAVTHRSYAFEHNLPFDNERLEFLGDSLIGFVVAAYFYEKFPQANEGELSKMKAAMVSRSMLGRWARNIGLGEILLLGKGEEKSGGRKRLSLIGSALEAFIGALYLEIGLERTCALIRTKMVEYVAVGIDSEAFTDYKSRFQELVQQRFRQIPEYHIVSESGPDHNKRFCIEARLNDQVFGRGWGPRKKAAENAAAKEALNNFDQIAPPFEHPK